MDFLQSRFGYVLLAVNASPGAMGASGTIKLFINKDFELIQHKVDVQIDEDLYYEVSKWFLEHSDNYPDYLKSYEKANKEPKLKRSGSIPIDKLHFDEFYLGFGNNLFLRKIVNFELLVTNIVFQVENHFHEISLKELPPSDEMKFIFSNSAEH